MHSEEIAQLADKVIARTPAADHRTLSVLKKIKQLAILDMAHVGQLQLHRNTIRQQIVLLAGETCGVEPEQWRTQRARRLANLTDPKIIAAVILREHGYTLTEIASEILGAPRRGGRVTHAAADWWLKQAEQRNTDAVFAAKLATMRAAVVSRLQLPEPCRK